MRGGKRDGAGRPPGSANVKTREIANRAALEGITPLEVMLSAMREAWDKNEKAAACAIAKDAAPYMHARLTSVDATVDGQVSYEGIAIPIAERDPLDAAERAASGGDQKALG